MASTPTAAPSGIKQAVTNFGTQASLAETLGLSQQTISAWLIRGYVPLKHAGAVSALTGVPQRALVNPKILAATHQGDLF